MSPKPQCRRLNAGHDPEIEGDLGKPFDLLMERTHLPNRWTTGAVCIVDESFD
jgi:hypothetical protein